MKEVWAQSSHSGLDKQQGTVQITAFADGIDMVRPKSSLKEKVFESLQRGKSLTANASKLCFKRKLDVMRIS